MEYRPQYDPKLRGVSAIYRYFGESAHADALLSGFVWITTIFDCQKKENAEQGDLEEGVQHYETGHIEGELSDPEVQRRLKLSSMRIPPGKGTIILSDNHIVRRMPDSFVLCTSLRNDVEKFKGAFGAHCVKISDPFRFYTLVTTALIKQEALIAACIGKVIYRDRSHEGEQQSPGPLGYVKPAVPYAPQQEVRLLWMVPKERQATLKPFGLEVPGVKPLCERIA